MDHKVLHSHRSGTSVLASMHHFGTTMMVKHVRRDMAETTNGVSHCLKPARTLKKLHKAAPSQRSCRSDTTHLPVSAQAT